METAVDWDLSQVSLQHIATLCGSIFHVSADPNFYSANMNNLSNNGLVFSSLGETEILLRPIQLGSLLQAYDVTWRSNVTVSLSSIQLELLIVCWRH